MRNGGDDGEICRHSVAPLAWERGSQEIEEWTPGGQKRSPRGVKFRPPGGPKWLSGGLWRPPGASWAAGQAQEGALGGKGSLLFFFETAKQLVLELPGSILGTSWRLLGRVWVLPPPSPREGPGEAPGGHFWRFCETCSPRGEKDRKINIC